MSISDAVNNAKQKINNVYMALESKGAEMPQVKDLYNMVFSVNSVSSQIFNWWYGGSPNGQVTLYEYGGDYDNTVVVPNANYIKINSLSGSPFYNNQGVISTDLQHIPFVGNDMSSVFYNCSNMKSAVNINVAEGVTSVNNMFNGCTSAIKLSSREGYHGIADVYFPDSVTSAQNIYRNCVDIESFVIKGNSVTSLDGALSGCTNALSNGTFAYIQAPNVLSATNFWNNYTTSGGNRSKVIYTYYTFANGESTPTYNLFKTNSTYTGGMSPIPGSNEYINTTTNFSLRNLGDLSANIQYTLNDKNLTFTKFTGGDLASLWSPYPEYEVEKFYTNCFTNSNIKDVRLNYIPVENNSLRNAFKNCNYLYSISGLNESIVDMSNTFCDCVNFNQSIQIPNSVTNMSYTFAGCSSFNQPVQIPSSVTSMESTFSLCTSLNRAIQISDGVLDMSSTFYYCNNFNQAVQIPSSVTNMEATFIGCSNFNRKVNIPSSVTDLLLTFYGCSSLKNRINIFSTEVEIAISCFDKTDLAKSVYIPYTYSNGDYTKTYNAFQEAGYFTGINGVTMYDIGVV